MLKKAAFLDVEFLLHRIWYDEYAGKPGNRKPEERRRLGASLASGSSRGKGLFCYAAFGGMQGRTVAGSRKAW